MLTQEDNDLLCRVGPGTPMGETLRQYWHPNLLSTELPTNASAHRGASLFCVRNEEDGLRCVYHGWKYDVAGRCVDMPNEPPESNFKDKIRQAAYPCREYGGMIWSYM